MLIARQSTARTVTVGPVLDADGVAVTNGVVADFKISKNGAAPAALNGSATLTHRHTGHYSLALTASDLDTVGTAEVVIDDTVNACPMKEISVLEEAVYDLLYAAGATGNVTLANGAHTITNLTLTGALTVQGGATLTSMVDDVPGLKIAGTGANNALEVTSTNQRGAVFTGDFGFQAVGTSAGICATGVTDGHGARFFGAGTGHGLLLERGSSSADDLRLANADTNLQLPSNGLANVTAWTVNVTGNLSGSVGSVTNPVTITGDAATAGTRFLTMIEVDGAVYRYTTNALEQGPAGGGGSAAAVWEYTVEGAFTAEQLLRGIASFAMGKANGGRTTTVNFRNLGDSKNRITATVDSDGNRTAVTRDLT